MLCMLTDRYIFVVMVEHFSQTLCIGIDPEEIIETRLQFSCNPFSKMEKKDKKEGMAGESEKAPTYMYLYSTSVANAES